LKNFLKCLTNIKLSCQNGKIFFHLSSNQPICKTFQGNEPVWRGYLYAAILSVSGLSVALADSHYWYKVIMIGFRVKAALIIAVYKKALVLSNTSRKEKTGNTVGTFNYLKLKL